MSDVKTSQSHPLIVDEVGLKDQAVGESKESKSKRVAHPLTPSAVRVIPLVTVARGWYYEVKTMLRHEVRPMLHMESPPLRVSRQLFEQLAIENPETRLERASDGTLLVMPPTGSEGGRRNTKLIWQLAAWNEATGLGEVFDSSTGFELPDGSIRAADAAWASSTRWQRLTEDERETFAPLCPDFVVELRSRTDRVVDLYKKMNAYVANGARLGWLIDPYERSVEIFRSGRKVEVLLDPETVSGEDVLPGFVLRLAGMFAA
jgi:Uma2 family endonuclease